MTMSEGEKFDATVRKVLSVSHDELMRREKLWREDRKRAKKAQAKKAKGK